MTTTIGIDFERTYTKEEQDAMLEAYFEAVERNDHEEAESILIQMPIIPRWAKYVREILGKEFLLKNFNITDANREFGEDWLNE